MRDSCYEVLVTGTSAGFLTLEQVRGAGFLSLEQVRGSCHWVLGRNSGEKGSVPIFLLSQFYHFTYHYIIRYQNKKQDNKNKTS